MTNLYFIKKICVCGFVLLIAACGASNKQKTLGQLSYEPEQDEELAVESMDHQQVREEYRELLHLFEDDLLKEQIERRIADVYMMEGVQKQSNDTGRPKSYYVEAIKSYRDILEKYPDSPDNAEVLYQLAKAYDMEGNQREALKMLDQLTLRHPYYINIAEANFRKGDILFGYQRYALAEKSYQSVAQSGNEKFIVNAHYMMAWAQYKQAKYRKSIDGFVFVLDSLFSETMIVDELSKAHQSMVSDTLHSVSLAVDKIGGAPAIEDVAVLASKEYVWMIYKTMGDYYLEKELYELAAESFRSFVMAHPNAEQAPGIHEKLVETYVKGGFPNQSLIEKESYIAAYGIYSSYAGNVQGIRDDIQPTLKIYLEELAQHNHATGQDLLEEIEQKKQKKEAVRKLANMESKALVYLDKASVFYQQYIDTFPQDSRIDEMRFLKAEVLFEAERFEEAVGDYELVAYQPLGESAKEHAADSGYAAIICYEKIIAKKVDGSDELKRWQSDAVESMLRFSEKFDSDERSPSVLTSAAEYMFSLDQYERAVTITEALIANNAALDPELKKTAYGIMAHSFFKLNKYQQAEAAYTNQRTLVAVGSEEYTAITERLASAVYKHSETLADSGEMAQAADSFLRIKSLAPNSTVRATAQYDAVVMLLSLEAWDRAIPELKELQALYPEHKMALEFPRQLAFSYEKSEQWALAAEEYLGLSKNDPDPEIKREALFLAAMMYEKNKNHTTAITLFKRYAYTYEQPFDTRMEARYHLATNYQTLGDIGKKLYWLRRIIDGDKQGGGQRTERSRWLGAWANMEYGNYFDAEFRKTRLRLPLVQSLPRKNEKLQSALQRYQSAADYGFLEFVTESSYKIGRLYQIFAQDLRDSPIPSGMSENDRRTYREIIEEQALPFELLAREVHTANVSRAWGGDFNPWIEKSFEAMRELYPERFNKDEQIVSYGDEIR
ncbi:Tetratricopeptide repeat-containing protein [Alteromonadaceae bacterium Bs31]|nr:Tetratricopeptide repeat-containing protein [Alteromonadaceae bacterium Bs31]